MTTSTSTATQYRVVFTFPPLQPGQVRQPFPVPVSPEIQIGGECSRLPITLLACFRSICKAHHPARTCLFLSTCRNNKQMRRDPRSKIHRRTSLSSSTRRRVLPVLHPRYLSAWESTWLDSQGSQLFVVTNANMIFDPPFYRPGPPMSSLLPPSATVEPPASTPWSYPPLEFRSSINARIKQSTRSGTGGCTGCNPSSPSQWLLGPPMSQLTNERKSPHQASCHRLKRSFHWFYPTPVPLDQPSPPSGAPTMLIDVFQHHASAAI